jgi:hypothetical protein
LAERTWEFSINNQQHTVRLSHGHLSGKRKVWVDDELIVEAQNLIDSGSRHSFLVAEHPCEVGITTNGITFSYHLLIDSIIVPSQQDARKKRPSRQQKIAIKDSEYWQTLSQATGLDSMPIPRAQGVFSHRMVGKVDNFLVVVQYLQESRNAFIPLIGVLVRYVMPPLATETIKAQLINDPTIQMLLEKRIKRKDVLDIQEDYALVTLLCNQKKETALQLADRILTFVRVITSYTRPLPEKVCENIDCHSQGSVPLELVFLNGFPRFMCHSCVEGLNQLGEKAKENYRAIPNRLLQGALAGLAGMIVGSILWAVVVVLLDRIGAVFAAAIMAGVVKIMDWRQTKRSIWSVLIAAVYTMGAVIIGTYLAVLWHGYQKLGMPSSVDFFWKVWQVTWQTPEILNQALFIGGIGVILAIWQVLSNQKRALSRYFKPHIEIIKPKEV